MFIAAWVFGGLLVLFLIFVVLAPPFGRPIDFDPSPYCWLPSCYCRTALGAFLLPK